MSKEDAKKVESQDEGATTTEASTEAAKSGSGPLAILMPPDALVLSEARRLVADRSTRMEDLQVCASQDPIIVIELLRVANAMFFSGGRAAITSAKTAVIRLGADVVLETFDKLKERPQIEDEEVANWLEVHRGRGRRASIVATILSEALARNFTEDCQVAGLLLFVGEMLAVSHLKERYVKLASEVSRGSMFYRLSQDFRFDVERMNIQYLRRHGIPEGILFVLDRDARPRQADRAVMKPICQSAGELVDAFDQNRIDRFAPGKIIPPKSALRTLQMNDQQYLKVYERVAEFLFSFKLIEEKKKKGAELVQKQESIDIQPDPQPTSSPVHDELQSEIQNILKGGPTEQDQDEVQNEVQPDSTEEGETKIEQIDSKLGPELADFNLGSKNSTTTRVARVSPSKQEKVVEPPKVHTKSGSAFLSSVSSMMDQAKSSEELLSQILGKLVKPEGPFEKAAIIVVSGDRKSAIVVAARGPIGSGQKIKIDDPLNPLAQCFSKVQSYGNKKNNVSPWGSRAFAVAPIDADHSTPVALYADCGVDGAVTFEARRIFRNVIEILNQKLPELPGGIPNELKA